MPRYDYECKFCGKKYVKTHNINDKPVLKCEICKNILVKLFNPTPSIWHTDGNYGKDSDKI